MSGTLIALEGADGAGCTDLARRLGSWLSLHGHQVVPCRIKGSDLMRRPLQALQGRADLSDRTLFLLYAADLADLFRHQIGPALELGQVVLCDRFLLTPLVRALARGIDRQWALTALSFLPPPDLTLLLHAPARGRLERLFVRHRFLQPRELGWPTQPGDRLLAQALRYQRRLARLYEIEAVNWPHQRLNTARPVERAEREAEAAVSALFSLVPVPLAARPE